MYARILFISTLLLLNTIVLFAQEYFEVNGRPLKVTDKYRLYHFYYDVNDGKIKVHLADSAILLENSDARMKKSIYYSFGGAYNGSNGLTYRNIYGLDSVSMHFNYDKLLMTYKTLYDEKGRDIYYALEDTRESNHGFEMKYVYKDSMNDTGRIEICTLFHLANEWKPERTQITFFDIDGRERWSVIERWFDGYPSYDSARYIYNAKGTLVGVWHIQDGEEAFYTDYTRTAAYTLEKDIPFDLGGIEDVTCFIEDALEEYREKFGIEIGCEFYLHYTFKDKDTRLRIVNPERTNRCTGFQATFYGR